MNPGRTRPRLSRRHAGDSGFTLIEVLVVIVILAVLAAVVVFAVGGISNRGETSACASDRQTIVTAIEAYQAQRGAVPASLTDLSSGNRYLHDDGSISATEKQGNGYTLTYTPVNGTLSACASAPAAGGGSPLATASAGPTASPSAASSVTAAVVAGNASVVSGVGVSRTWAVTMTITVTDGLGQPVSGASVTGAWAFSFSGNPLYRGTGTNQTTCTSGSNGTCTLNATGMQSGVGSASLTVQSVVKGGLAWSHPSPVSASRNRPF